MNNKEILRQQIHTLIKEYAENHHNKKLPYQPGNRIPYASRIYDHEEMCNLVDSALEFWLTASHWADTFEKELAAYLGVQHCMLVNSGSSANLLAFMALTSPMLGERAIRRGDEVITVACAFPTTVSPIVQYGAVSVFADVTIPQYNIDVTTLENALSEKTKAVMLAHTLGNPFDIAAVKTFCDKHNLWLIEDNCDALGATYTMDGKSGHTGTFGDIGTSSFYPAHHMTMGEGGAVYTNDALLGKIMLSMRDWGRDCVCPPGNDNMCGHRFDGQHGELPKGYDHKYVYGNFGYNLKVTDMQAAIGCAQIKKLPGFVEKRRKNFQKIKDGLLGLEDRLILPEACPDSNPSWFGFPLTCRENVYRDKVVEHLEKNGVQTRMLFAGNIVKHPCFDEMRKTGTGYRIVGELRNTECIMNDTFWVGVYPGLSEDEIDWMTKKIREAVK